MTNIQAPFGFRPLRRVDGAAPNYALPGNPYLIAFNNSHTIARGDPVVLLASGFLDNIAPGTTPILGIFMGCEYVDPNFQRKVWFNAWKAPSLTSGTQVIGYVIDDPRMVFEAQSQSAAVVQGNVGNNINFIGQSNPNSAGISQAAADQTTINTTPTLPFRIIGLGQRIGNDNTSGFNTIEVMINASQLANTTGV